MGSGSRRGPTGSLIRNQAGSKRGVGFSYWKSGYSIKVHTPGGVNMSQFPLPLNAMHWGGGVGLSATESLYRGDQVVKVMRTLPPWVAGARAGEGSAMMSAAATPVDKLSESHVKLIASGQDSPNGPVWMSHVYDIANTRFVFEVDSTTVCAVGILFQHTWEIGQDYDEVVPLWIVLHAYVRGALSP